MGYIISCESDMHCAMTMTLLSSASLGEQKPFLGEFTVARMDQENGDYMMLAGTCKTTPGPVTHGTFLWGEFEDLQAWEDRLLEGPYIHHFVEIEGDYTKELKEFCKYFRNLKMDESIKPN